MKEEKKKKGKKGDRKRDRMGRYMRKESEKT